MSHTSYESVAFFGDEGRFIATNLGFIETFLLFIETFQRVIAQLIKNIDDYLKSDTI